MNPADIVVSNSFTCQSVTDVIDEAVSDTLDSGPFATTTSIGLPSVDTVAGFLVATGVLTPEQAAGLPTNPNMSQGTITLPTIYPGSADPVLGFLPPKVISLLIMIPSSIRVQATLPILRFQHGTTPVLNSWGRQRSL